MADSKKYHVSKNILNPESTTTNTQGEERYGDEFPAGTYYIYNGTGANMFWRDGISSTQGITIAALSDAIVTSSDTLVVWYSYIDNRRMVAESSVAIPFELYGNNTWQHSLRKLTTATEIVQNPLYADGTAITSYTIKGNTVQSGTPTPSAPISVQGVGNKTANLFNATVEQGSITSSGDIEASNRVRTKEYIDVPTGDIAISWNSSQNTDLYIMTYNASGTYINGVGWKTSPATITISGNEAKIRLIWRYNSQADITPSAITNVMINSGSTALPYEPYGYKIPISSGGVTTPIYLTEPLMKKDTVVDDFSSSGTATYNIKKMVLNGSEDWQTEMTDNFYINTPLSGNTGKATVLCTHQVSTSNSYVSGENCFISPSGRFNFTTSAITHTVNDFKTWVQQQYAAGTPVTVWYVMETPTTETVTAPTIPTTEGANTITVDTTVQPSEFTATWTGWHDSSVKEYDGSDWQ